MKTLFTLLLAICAATGYGQTIKTLGYNTTNGRVVYSGTNTLTFTNAVLCNANVSAVDLGADNLTVEGAIYFTEALTNIAVTRTNLGLGATWLTNTNVTNFRSAIGLGATNSVIFQVIEAPGGLVSGDISVNSSGMFGFGASVNLEEGFLYCNNGASDWNFEGSGIGQSGIISFKNSTNASTTRTNLGIPLAALTNTSNVTAMRALSGSTNTNHPFSGSVALTNTNVLVFSNGILQSVQ